jgi:hypothetical protein
MTRRSAGSNWKDAYPTDNLDSDASALIGVILDNWQNTFKEELRGIGRSLLGEARNWRNQWAHSVTFSDADTHRALDTVQRLLTLIDAPEATEVGRSWDETQPVHVKVEAPSPISRPDGSPDRMSALPTTDAAARSLRGEFTRAMLEICDRFKREIDYNPTRFRQMVVEHGGPEAASRLLAGAHVQLGLETLRWHGRLDEGVEAHVLLPRFESLSTDDERRIARARLLDHGFDVDAFLRGPG